MSKTWMIREFLSFYAAADTVYQVHSPFVFDFVQAVLEDDRWFYAFSELEAFRASLMQNHQSIAVTDYGAGSKKMKGRQRTVRQIAQSSLSGPNQCRQLFRLVQHFRPKKIIELGTSLGLSTLYFRAAALNAQIFTLEGCPEIAKLARKHFKDREAKNIQLLEGRFQDQLPKVLSLHGPPDLVFIDGHHLKAPTLDYFQQCLDASHENTLFLFDDIHWSPQMVEAWQSICAHSDIRLTIDLFHMGIAMRRPAQQEREHFKLVPQGWKFWKVF
ncbi:MAG: class I SAM-dependent methyltransferase [Bacteroidota bacterium]